MWFHMAMCFGAAASVWNFNSTADALQALMRVLLWVLSGHFVDDFNGVDVDGLAEGAFGGMAEFLELLGLQTKPSKAQKPAKEHIIQGVLVAITSDGVVLRPTPARVKKITQSTFGAVRKAALQPVYARAAAVSDTRLSVGLRAALSSPRALLALANIQPKVIPYIDDGAPAAIIYADAFYVPARRGQTQSHIPAEVNVRPGTRGRNGWRMGAELFYDWGTAPAEFLEAFAARKAFISGDLGSSPPLPVAGVHRQCRRPVGPYQGVRQVPGSQWRPGGLWVNGGPGGLAP